MGSTSPSGTGTSRTSAFSTNLSCWTARSQGCRHPVTRGWRWYPQPGDLVNRFFRSALFPLVIIAALVWLALQTLGGGHEKTVPIQTSQFIQAVENPNAQVTDVVIDPNKQSISATVTDRSLTPALTNQAVTIHYASPQAEAPIEEKMLANDVEFNSK